MDPKIAIKKQLEASAATTAAIDELSALIGRLETQVAAMDKKIDKLIAALKGQYGRNSGKR